MDTHTHTNYLNNLPARGHRNQDWRLDVSKQKILPCLGQTIPPLPAFPEEFSECISKFHARIPVAFVEGMPSPTTPCRVSYNTEECVKLNLMMGDMWTNIDRYLYQHKRHFYHSGGFLKTSFFFQGVMELCSHASSWSRYTNNWKTAALKSKPGRWHWRLIPKQLPLQRLVAKFAILKTEGADYIHSLNK